MTLTNSQFIYAGDSLGHRGGGVTVSGTGYSTAVRPGSSCVGFIGCASGNRLVTMEWYNYGVGSQTTAGLKGRIGSARRDDGSSGGANPGFAVTGQAADAFWNLVSDGQFPGTTSPDKIAVVLMGTNDTNIPVTPLVSMQNLANIVDGLIAGGKETVAVGNLITRGTAYTQDESHTIASGTTTYATSVATFIRDASAWGDVAAQVVVGATPTVLTKVVGTPTAGQFAISGSSFVISAADATTYNGLKLFVSYSHTTAALKTGTAYSSDEDVSEWVFSAASNFVATFSGTNYGIPGLLFGRPQVIPVDTYGTLQDPATSGSSKTNRDYYSVDGLHMLPRSSHAIGKVFAARILTRYPTLISQARTPVLNNWILGTGNTVTTLFTGTLPVAMRGTPAAGSVITIRANVNKVGTVNASTGVVTGDFTGTVNFTTGAISVTAGTAPGSSQRVVYCQDDDNLLINGLCDINHGTGTALPSYITGDTLPLRYFASADSGSQTAVSGGGLTITHARVAGPNGVGTGLKFTISGLAGTGIPTLTLGNTIAATDFLGRVPTTAFNYAACYVKIEAGPNGHLSGLNGFNCSNPVTTSAVTRSGTGGIVAITGSALGGESGTATRYVDGDLTDAGGSILLELMSPPMSMASTVISALSNTMRVLWDPSVPVSCSITFGQIAIKNYVPNITLPVLGVTGTTDNGTAINLGSVTIGVAATQQLTITNSGTAIDTLGTLSIVGTGWSISGGDNPSGLTVAMAGSRTVTVSLTATSVGVKTAVLTIPSNDPDSPFLVNLTATASDAGGGFTAAKPPVRMSLDLSLGL